MSLSIHQEPKYDIVDGKHVNRATGVAIPDGEPIIIFRAKDLKAVIALSAYRDACNDVDHRAVIDRRISQFNAFALAFPQLMKEPDTAITPIALSRVTSSNVEAIGYDGETETLAVEFKSSDVYHYLNVPGSAMKALNEASSLGSFIAKEIRPAYAHIKLNREPATA
jgi:hypothetical protein